MIHFQNHTLNRSNLLKITYRCFALATISLVCASCKRAFMFSPSSHHVPAFTKKKQVSVQAGYRNQHIGYSFANHWAVKASYFQRNVRRDQTLDQWNEEHTYSKKGHYFDSEIGAGYFNPELILLREIYLGAGFGKTAYHFKPPQYGSDDQPIDFYSKNYSLYGQYSIELPISELVQGFLTYKSKLTKINQQSSDQLYWFTKKNQEGKLASNPDYIWFNQVSFTLRNKFEDRPFYYQVQSGLSFGDKKPEKGEKMFCLNLL